jgi:RHS repeat-associated protein
VIEEYNGAATPARQRYYIWGNYVDELLLLNDDAGDDSDYFVCHDQIYSPQALLSSTGSIVERYDTDAYGQPVIYTATATGGGDGDWWDGDETTSDTSAKGLVYLFTGRELDNLDGNALKVYYYRARSYDPLYGRFLQRDPVGYVDGMNLYEYVQSYPTMKRDPTGMIMMKCVPGDSYYYPESKKCCFRRTYKYRNVCMRCDIRGNWYAKSRTKWGKCGAMFGPDCPKLPPPSQNCVDLFRAGGGYIKCEMCCHDMAAQLPPQRDQREGSPCLYQKL